MMRDPITFHNEAGQTMAEYAVVLGVITESTTAYSAIVCPDSVWN